MKYLKIAWLNLWRNKRRSLITIASIFFGVLLATIMNSLQDGTYANMIDMMVKLSSGYIQVQNPEYFENKSINNTFSPTDEFMARLESQPGVTTMAKRLESFALISSGPNTRGGAVIGFEPAKDSQTSNLQNWISDGEFLNDGDNGLLVTFNIAKHLDLHVNDTIILISQGYRGVTAAGKYPIKGILTFSTPQMNNIGVFMDITLAQNLFSAEGMTTSVMVMVHDYTDVNSVKRSIQGFTAESLSVYSWDELNPEVVQFIESDKAGGVIMIGILYIVIGFGIFGTIIMMVAERKREMAVMVAVGMQKYKLATILFFETLLIGIVGVISGFVVSVPIILFMVGNPIELPADLAEAYIQYGFEPYLFFGMAPEVFWQQVLTVFAITLVISIYPMVKVKNMVVSRSLKA
ncbi:MAG: ABC transporter permease [Tenuifilaceae bacterium]|jgi:ABC-type lipoprotein release transport system permease subunit|nr:ABC transporter permease [Tenuifilaceae bacterium]